MYTTDNSCNWDWRVAFTARSCSRIKKRAKSNSQEKKNKCASRCENRNCACWHHESEVRFPLHLLLLSTHTHTPPHDIVSGIAPAMTNKARPILTGRARGLDTLARWRPPKSRKLSPTSKNSKHTTNGLFSETYVALLFSTKLASLSRARAVWPAV